MNHMDIETKPMRWRAEAVCSPTHRRSYTSKTQAGTFHIVPADYMPLVDLMEGRSIPLNGYEVHLEDRIIATNCKTLSEAKAVCRATIEC
jgi:hypothetical protein